MKRKTIAEILTEQFGLSKSDIDRISSEASVSGIALQQYVVNKKIVEKHKLLKTISSEWKVKVVDLQDLDIDPDVSKFVPVETCKRHKLVPFSKEEDFLFIAMVDPRDLFVIEDIELRTGLKVVPYLALPDDIKDRIEQLYGTPTTYEESVSFEEKDTVKVAVSHEELTEDAKELTQELLASLDVSSEVSVEQQIKEEITDIMQVSPDAPEVEKLVNALILEAVRLKASDIHIEPFEKKILVRYRVDGLLRKASFKIPIMYKNALISKIKIMCNMNIVERRIPQDGRLQVKAKGVPLEFRVSVVPTIYGESVVMRMLDRSGAMLPLEALGFLPDTLEKFVYLLNRPYGLILVCGPTGSGKSFTLTAALQKVKDPQEKVITAENPVEYELDGVVQVPINPDLKMGDRKFDFAMALRAFLRQDPDIIMVGEIRDQETAQVAMEAALTGHLVLSTLHTNDAPSAVARLYEMGVPTYLIANTLEGVLAQRLVRTLCNDCKQPDNSPSEELISVLKEYNIDYSNATFMKPVGCRKCGNTGMKGRTALHELLVMNDELRELCLKELSANRIREVALKTGMRTLLVDGLIKVTKGITTYSEVLSVCQR
ncbi:MAG: ATPase, T2SS/T4P/T4SS family [Endomicrobia bacterium]|nr:ATPase, T2SS/T4P/T4SS family [Endomicrobiia bacterium]MCX7940175.1 ATPase, T2SS/T4P/T4SS family [Endomicrobiia bacterium]MDW8055696.1 ATPase, T2SS/T4P/T4SS family [Elusimicrobiota bacterium]